MTTGRSWPPHFCMTEFIALFLICLVASLGAAVFIHYFWRIRLARALGYAAFFVAMFLVFWASGLWVNASRHSWGVLAPIFALFMVLGWICLKFGPGLFRKLIDKINKINIE